MKKPIIIIILIIISFNLVSCSNDFSSQSNLETNKSFNNNLASTNQVRVEISENNSVIKVFEDKDLDSKEIDREEYILSYKEVVIETLHDEDIFDPYGETWTLTIEYMRDLYSLILHDEKIMLDSMALIINTKDNRSYIYSRVLNDYGYDLIEYRDELYNELGRKFPLEFTYSKYPIIPQSTLSIDNLRIENIDSNNNMIVGSIVEDLGGMFMLSMFKFQLTEDAKILNESDEIDIGKLEEGMQIIVQNDTTKLDDKNKAFQINYIEVKKAN